MIITMRKLSATLMTLAATSAISVCQAEETSPEELEQANLEKALYCMEVLEVELDLEKAGRECIGETYIQHSPHVPDGREGMMTYFAKRIEENPEMHADIKRAGADGDLVWIHLHFKNAPDDAGHAVINIFRMEGGKFVEHWGVGQPVPETSVHGNSMF